MGIPQIGGPLEHLDMRVEIFSDYVYRGGRPAGKFGVFVPEIHGRKRGRPGELFIRHDLEEPFFHEKPCSIEMSPASVAMDKPLGPEQ